MLDINNYNRLPSISTASTTLHAKLASSNLTLDALLTQLRPLFTSAEHKGKYGVWLLHHHFDLEEGERMVKRGAVTQPSREQSARIVAERWGAGGEELEHAYYDFDADSDEGADGLPPPPPPPPPAEFIRQFQAITGAYGIDCLGICVSPSHEEIKMMQEGYLLLETCHQGRKHVLTPTPAADPSLESASVFSTTWSMASDASFGLCSHGCNH